MNIKSFLSLRILPSINHLLLNIKKTLTLGCRQTFTWNLVNISGVPHIRSESFPSVELHIGSRPGVRRVRLPQPDSDPDVFISRRHQETPEFPPHSPQRPDKQKEMCLCSNLRPGLSLE